MRRKYFSNEWNSHGARSCERCVNLGLLTAIRKARSGFAEAAGHCDDINISGNLRRNFTRKCRQHEIEPMKVYSLDEVEERWKRVRTSFKTPQIPSAEFDLFEAEQPVLLEEARKKGQELFDDSNKIVAPLIFTWTLMKEANDGEMGRITAAHLDRAQAETNALDVIYEEEAEARADEVMFEWAARFPQAGIMEWLAWEFSEEGLEGHVELTPVNSVEAFDWLGTCLLAMCYEIGA